MEARPKKALRGLFTRTEAKIEPTLVQTFSNPNTRLNDEPSTRAETVSLPEEIHTVSSSASVTLQSSVSSKLDAAAQTELESPAPEKSLASGQPSEATPAATTLPAATPLPAATTLPAGATLPAVEVAFSETSFTEAASAKPKPKVTGSTPKLDSTPKAQAVVQKKTEPVPTEFQKDPSGSTGIDERCDVTSQRLAPLNTQIELSANREGWTEQSYLQLIKKIDRAQTEAFLMKGKLLDEVKSRFFLESKTGWKQFCEDKLEMNYTTANQYIRVAVEFEQIASSRPEYGFEHFKALLPLRPDQREEILVKAESLSVKRLRQLASEFINAEIPPQTKNVEMNEAKNLVRNLELLKEQLYKMSAMGTLPQLQKWQLAAACSNLSDELQRIALQLNKVQTTLHKSDASDRVGASTHEAT